MYLPEAPKSKASVTLIGQRQKKRVKEDDEVPHVKDMGIQMDKSTDRHEKPE